MDKGLRNDILFDVTILVGGGVVFAALNGASLREFVAVVVLLTVLGIGLGALWHYTRIR